MLGNNLPFNSQIGNRIVRFADLHLSKTRAKVIELEPDPRSQNQLPPVNLTSSRSLELSQ